MNVIPAAQADLVEVVTLMNHAYRGGDGWASEGGHITGDRIRLPACRPATTCILWCWKSPSHDRHAARALVSARRHGTIRVTVGM